ncbi:unnamed protein product [Bacillus phage SPP1]|uniref:Bacteriophage SPP1 complete nucleotide sequence n=1 Tax=Bacillus phage SPP1 TaxID=10724 RepID=O48464_BPSPP|nr:hypothetical protein SPP1p044 [Bacillus phage SPP1]CAA66565.1 unnamed protein product [Bacillus phage SPP1]
MLDGLGGFLSGKAPSVTSVIPPPVFHLPSFFLKRSLMAPICLSISSKLRYSPNSIVAPSSGLSVKYVILMTSASNSIGVANSRSRIIQVSPSFTFLGATSTL